LFAAKHLQASMGAFEFKALRDIITISATSLFVTESQEMGYKYGSINSKMELELDHN
jgi:hypothetical protein